ncbi:MAG: hypothetical protein JXA10_02255 [Anaerolineae bacterium]|nr:hypothetical protein [Anaerolineae bacterium]
MSVFFSSEPEPDDPQLCELWNLLEDEHFDDAANLGETMCEDQDAPVESFCGFSLALGELGYYADAEELARAALGLGTGHWRARHALAVALMHQGRFLGALDTLGFYRIPDEIYVIRAQIERMGDFAASLQITLEDALQKTTTPRAIQLYLAYLHYALANNLPDWGDANASAAQIKQQGAHLATWERDAARHNTSAYGEHLAQHIAVIRQLRD